MAVNIEKWKQQWLRKKWPTLRLGSNSSHRVGIAIVNYNTRELVSHLLLSLYRVLDPRNRGPIVVVDNGSSDGSLPLLKGLENAGVIHLIANDIQRYHGPGLNQAVARLRRFAVRNAKTLAAFRYVWVLDSDTVVLRPEVLKDAISVLNATNAALVGEYQPDPVIPEGYAHVSSLLLDPQRVWQRRIKPFEEHGDPAQSLQVSLRAQNLRVEEFPFKKDNYILHIGRATLAQLKNERVTHNRYYSWAENHFQAHYSGNPNGPSIHEEYIRIFRSEVPTLSAESLVDACQRPARIELTSVSVGSTSKDRH